MIIQSCTYCMCSFFLAKSLPVSYHTAFFFMSWCTLSPCFPLPIGGLSLANSHHLGKVQNVLLFDTAFYKCKLAGC